MNKTFVLTAAQARGAIQRGETTILVTRDGLFFVLYEDTDAIEDGQLLATCWHKREHSNEPVLALPEQGEEYDLYVYLQGGMAGYWGRALINETFKRVISRRRGAVTTLGVRFDKIN